tara:strand:+ start:30967 stop:31176 length:210 start_codon:yes stop_codon:yes gene_type:complete
MIADANHIQVRQLSEWGEGKSSNILRLYDIGHAISVIARQTGSERSHVVATLMRYKRLTQLEARLLAHW